MHTARSSYIRSQPPDISIGGGLDNEVLKLTDIQSWPPDVCRQAVGTVIKVRRKVPRPPPPQRFIDVNVELFIFSVCVQRVRTSAPAAT